MQKRAAVLSVISLIGSSSLWAASDGTPDLAVEVSSASVLPSPAVSEVTTSSAAVSEVGASTAAVAPIEPAASGIPELPPPPAAVEVPVPPAVVDRSPGATESAVGNVVGTVQSVDRNGRSFILQD